MSLLDELEQPDDWQRLVEDWWIEQCFALRLLVAGGLRDDFLMHTVWEPPRRCRDDHHALFAKFGILHHYYGHWREDFDAGRKVANLRGLDDPPWGGLARWREMEKSPPPDDDNIPCSPTLVYKGSVLARNLAASGVDPKHLPKKVRTMVHWGGGIGLQSYVMRQWGATHTEYLIDLPVMSLIQHEFLTRNLGAEHVHLADTDVKDGVINVVPLSRLHLVPQGCDVFLSLHALSESTVAAQDEVVRSGWFGADKLVLEWTESHPHFAGSGHWAELVEFLEEEGRVAPRVAVRGDGLRTKWNGDVARLADFYEGEHGVPVLVLGPDNWVDLTRSDRAPVELDLLMTAVRANCPIIILDVTHAMNDRRSFEWVRGRVGMQRYRLEEQDEALVILDRDLFPSEDGANDD